MSRARAVCGIALVAAAFAGVGAAGCRRTGCVGGDDGQCTPVAACGALRYSCDALPGSLKHTLLDTNLVRLPGPKARAAVGDVELENDLVRLVIDAPDHSQNLAPSGGSILDFAPVGSTSGDQTNAFYQAAGLLPRDAVHYESWREEDQPPLGQNVADAFVAVILRGHLEGDPRVTVVTRYELRPCEPGVRVTTDLYNGAPDANTLYLADGLFWGDNTLAPFVPGEGLGFRMPDLDLLHLDRAWRQWPFLAARSQASPDVAYAIVPCDRGSGAGFNSTTLSASGLPLVPTLSGDGLHYERFILVTPGVGLAPAVGEALRVRTQVQGDPAGVAVTGRVVAAGVPIDGRAGRAASLLFYEPAPGANPDDEAHRIPWSEAVPATNGVFTVMLPPDRSYRVQPYAFGRPAAPATSFALARTAADIGDLTLTASARLRAVVQKTPGVTPATGTTYAELVVIPVGPASSSPRPSFYGLFPGCDPMLGPPHGGTPACNRAVTNDGTFDLLMPDGAYYVYATRGPFATLDRAEIALAPGDDVTLPFLVQDLPDILPAGVVSGDFHVHGAGSYDSSIPDQDRVLTFLASGVEVIVATDHDAVTSYEGALAALTVSPRTLAVIPGVEQTPNILWFDVPGQDFPKTLGHFNFWPLVPNTTAPRNGAPWDELQEPGQMMDAMDGQFAVDGPATGDARGVSQLNHPYMITKLGRDQGFTRAIGYNPLTYIRPGESFAADVLLHASTPGGRRNIDWDVQEVMTGASRADWLRYRALWFSMLSQGFLRAGAANSDTHTLGLEQVGYPRNLVFGGHRAELAAGSLDVAGFDADVRAGHMVGTNGPVLDVTIDDADGNLQRPGLTPIVVTRHGSLSVTVTAAPWIPVEEIRIFVNGELKVSDGSVAPIFAQADPFGTLAPSTAKTFALDGLLPTSGDAWLVVEAGMHQDTPEDGDGDGLPDLPEDQVPGRPAENDSRFNLEAIAPGVWPTAFSNPFLLNVDGGDWQPPGLTPPGQP